MKFFLEGPYREGKEQHYSVFFFFTLKSIDNIKTLLVNLGEAENEKKKKKKSTE